MSPRSVSFGRLKVPSSDEELIESLEFRAETLTKDRQDTDYQNRLNLSFYRGHHWVFPTAGVGGTTQLRRAIYNPNDPKSRVQVTTNKVAPHAERLIARITKGLPIPECRPVTIEERDMSAARVGSRILASEMERIHIQDVIVRLYFWVVLCRTGFIHPWWDAKDGPIVGEDDDGPLHLGNVNYDIISPFEVVLAPGSTTAPTARWAIRTMAMSAEEIYDRWDCDIEGKDYPRVSTVNDEMGNIADFFGQRESVEKFAVRQFWLPAGHNDTASDGFTLCWVGDQVLEPRTKKYPYDHNHIPLAQFNYLPSPYGWMGHTPIDDIVEMNVDYNHMRSRESDIRDRLVPKMIAALDSVDADAYSDLVETIFFKSAYGFEPKLTDTPINWMNMFEAGMNRVDAEMGERTSINEALQGDLAGTSPGISILAQQEAASEPLATPAKELGVGLSELGWQHLMLVKQFWEEDRVIRTWSESGRLEVDRFNKADIATELDVHVVTESSLPRSVAGRVELFFQLYDKGLITDPSILIRILDLPPTDVLAKSFDIDIRQAERENDEMAHARRNVRREPMVDAQGQPIGDDIYHEIPEISGVPTVHELDNHEIHVKVHNDYRKTEEWRHLSDAAKEAFEGHIRAHMTVLGTRLRAQQQAQSVGVDGPPAPPGAEAPGPGMNGQAPPPELTEIAQMGGRPGRPGVIPGAPLDQQAGMIGE